MFDRFFTFVYEVHFMPLSSIKFYHVFTLVQNPTCCLFLGQKMKYAANVTWFENQSSTWHFLSKNLTVVGF